MAPWKNIIATFTLQGDQYFNVSQKQRTGSGHLSATSLTEEFVVLKVKNKNLNINISKYQNGYYVYTRKITLQP